MQQCLIGITISSINSDLSSESYTIPNNSRMISLNTNDDFAWMYTYGGLYSWATATARTGISLSSGNASGSICPKGWKLPSGNYGDEYDLLNTAYGGSISAMSATPAPNFGKKEIGYGECSSTSVVTSYASWWSSTTSGTSGAYNPQMSVSSSRVFQPVTTDSRCLKLSIRCMLRY